MIIDLQCSNQLCPLHDVVLLDQLIKTDEVIECQHCHTNLSKLVCAPGAIMNGGTPRFHPK